MKGVVIMSTLSNSDKQSIERDLKSAVDSLIKGCEALDMDQAFEIFWESPEFRMVAMDGSLCDYQTYLRNNIDYLSECSRFELTTLDERLEVLTSDLAIFSWIYRVVATLKSGQQDLFDKAGASFVFRRLEDQWKVIYYHESTLPPTRI
jgi:hypothetical protein